VEQNISQYYQAMRPGEVQVLGVDLYNGTPQQLQGFKNQTGATYPLLLLGATSTGGNVADLYCSGISIPYDNYVVINKQGIVRYHAALRWPHGNRYHLDEIRGCVDSLVTPTVGVGEGSLPGLTLSAAPNPAFGRSTIAFSNPSAEPVAAEVMVHDLAGRRVATLWRGPAPAGTSRVEWNGAREDGAPAPAGLYLVTAHIGGRTLRTRLTLLR